MVRGRPERAGNAVASTTVAATESVQFGAPDAGISVSGDAIGNELLPFPDFFAFFTSLDMSFALEAIGIFHVGTEGADLTSGRQMLFESSPLHRLV
jgi:hypothetical protein